MTTLSDPTKLIEAFRDALTTGSVSTENLDAYTVDGMTPSVIVTPATQTEVAQALRLANQSDAAVVPFGGGTQQGMGMPPRRYDVALDLRRIDALVEHEPADLTATVEAGMGLSELQRRLGERGQWLPLDPPVDEAATIGGLLATNASGPARLSRGTLRDLLIGNSFATADGDLVKSGGRVVKNVAGYDLGKLQIGALGTLGVITQASFKVAPLPPAAANISIDGEVVELNRLALSLIEARLALQALLLTKHAQTHGWRLAARFAGGEAAVQRSLREGRSLAGGAAQELTDAEWRALGTPSREVRVAVRAAVPLSDLAPVAAALADARASVMAMPGVGVAYGSWQDDVASEVLESLRRACKVANGALVIEKAPLPLKQAIDVWGEPRGDFALMQRLKQQLDPKAVLNPGRYLGGI